MSDPIVIHTATPGVTRKLGERIGRMLRAGDVVLLSGDLGAGKTVLAQGIGRGLLKDAIQRTLQSSQQLGIRVLLCHAIDEEAKAFYLRNGFIESPTDAMTVMLSLASLQEAI